MSKPSPIDPDSMSVPWTWDAATMLITDRDGHPVGGPHTEDHDTPANIARTVNGYFVLRAALAESREALQRVLDISERLAMDEAEKELGAGGRWAYERFMSDRGVIARRAIENIDGLEVS